MLQKPTVRQCVDTHSSGALEFIVSLANPAFPIFRSLDESESDSRSCCAMRELFFFSSYTVVFQKKKVLSRFHARVLSISISTHPEWSQMFFSVMHRQQNPHLAVRGSAGRLRERLSCASSSLSAASHPLFSSLASALACLPHDSFIQSTFSVRPFQSALTNASVET